MPIARLVYKLRSWLCLPDVIVDVCRRDGILFFTIENIGESPAHNISACFDPPIQGIRGQVTVSDRPVFSTLEFLPPGKAIPVFLDVADAYFEREDSTRVTVTVAFENDGGTCFTRRITHNLGAYRELEGLPIASSDRFGSASFDRSRP